MISRRNLLAASATAVAFPSVVALASRASATSSTLNIDLRNNTGSNTVYAYITGLAIDNGNAWFLLQSDGRTPYYPPSRPRPERRSGRTARYRSGLTARPPVSPSRTWPAAASGSRSAAR